jgi:predicted kinase
MSTFILLSAIPGSGKSTWAKQYKALHPHVHVVSSDDVRKKVTGSQQDFGQEPLVWKTFLDTINDFALKEKECIVVADATNLENKFRRYYHDMTPAFDRHILVVFNIPYDICLKQNQMREAEKIVPVAAMERLHNQFEPPTEEIISLYDEYVVINKTFVSKEIAEQEAAAKRSEDEQ